MSDSGRARERGALDHPLATALIGLAVGCVVVAIRLAANEGDISRFVRAAPPWTDPASVPAGLTVVDAGYDGQFYYRLALDPFTDQRTAYGITLQMPAYVQQRIAYPLAAWALAGGDAGRTPVALVLVNLVGLGTLGWLGGALARRSGRHALWGAMFVLYPGFVITLSRDLTEIVAAVFLVSAVLLLRSGGRLAAALALTAAALARETTLLATAAFGATSFAAAPRRPSRWIAFAVPVAVIATWQASVAARWHELPSAEGSGSLDPPFLGLLAAAWLNADRLSGGKALLWLSIVAFVLATIFIAARSLPEARPFPGERVAWFAYVGLATVLEANIWANGAVLRALTELSMLGTVFVLGATGRLRWALLALELALSIALLWTGVEI